MNLIEELRWRGMIQDIMPGTEEQLNREMTTGYIGFDPTADSLHIGSLVPILLLVHLQKAGHKPIALVGGATGMIGDPSGKSEERALLSEAELRRNVAGLEAQLAKFLDFSANRDNAAEMANNYEWFSSMSLIEFLRDAGKHITVNYMMAKDSVKRRIESEEGLSYTEFAYQMMQGYDFYWLHRNRNCRLQMGGSDQWGNIVTGTELIRKKTGGHAFAFTCPLITKADGTKFGKTESGNVWLDPAKTTPYQFYQFWLNATDPDADRWISIFTFLDRHEIESLRETHRRDPAKRVLQKKLAEEVTRFVHGQEGLEEAITTTEKLFQRQSLSPESFSLDDLESLEGIIRADYSRPRFEGGVDVVSFLAETGIFPSKGEARKTILNGGVSINRKKIADAQLRVDGSFLLHDRYVLVQKGRKHYYLVHIA
ncbi:MAG TPA: tyrosine--tRNA ligase [Chitinophagaceae bacterium]|nr:tyrosine--tRNA ligase [Chitinophagaceae bacterium]